MYRKLLIIIVAAIVLAGLVYYFKTVVFRNPHDIPPIETTKTIK